MVTTAISPEQDVVTAEVFIAAPRERVFQAITDPAQVPRWWGQQDMYRITEWQADLRPGGKWSSIGVRPDGSSFRVNGEYLAVDPPRHLAHTWIATWAGELKTTVYWDLEERDVHGLQGQGPKRVGKGTLLKLRHEGFGGAPEAAEGHSKGWSLCLSWMQAFVERAETVDSRK